MTDRLEDRVLSLAVPPDAAYVGTVRLFASAVGRHVAADDELVDDLKLALAEAVAEPIEAGVSGDIEILAILDAVPRFEVRSEAWTEASINGDTAFMRHGELVRALFADTEVVVVDGSRLLRFSLGSRALP